MQVFFLNAIDTHSQLEIYTTNLFNMQELSVNDLETHSHLEGVEGMTEEGRRQ